MFVFYTNLCLIVERQFMLFSVLLETISRLWESDIMVNIYVSNGKNNNNKNSRNNNDANYDNNIDNNTSNGRTNRQLVVVTGTKHSQKYTHFINLLEANVIKDKR